MRNMPEQEEVPSLQVIASRITAEREATNAHSESLDAKAGVVLGFAGVLVGLGATAQSLISKSPLSQIGLGMTIGSAVLAALAFAPRKSPVLTARLLRDRYLTAAEEETVLVLLDTEIKMINHATEHVKLKGRFLSGAIFFLASAVVLIVIGTLIAGGQTDVRRGPTPAGRSTHSHVGTHGATGAQSNATSQRPSTISARRRPDQLPREEPNPGTAE